MFAQLGIKGQGVKRILNKLVGPASQLLDKVQQGSWDQITNFLLEPNRRAPGEFNLEIEELLQQIDIQDRNVCGLVGGRNWWRVGPVAGKK